jgi:hypothetical protein
LEKQAIKIYAITIDPKITNKVSETPSSHGKLVARKSYWNSTNKLKFPIIKNLKEVGNF